MSTGSGAFRWDQDRRATEITEERWRDARRTESSAVSASLAHELSALRLDAATTRADTESIRQDDLPSRTLPDWQSLARDVLRTSSARRRPATAPLTSAEQQLVRRIWRQRDGAAVLSHLADVHVRLRGSDLCRLQGTRWLNDEVVNAYGALLNRCYRRHGIYCFNSFFYTRLTRPAYAHAAVQRWTRRAQVCLPRESLLLLPINLRQYHWVLGVVDVRRRQLRLYDAVQRGDYAQVLPTLWRWVADEARLHRHASGDAMAQSPWSLVVAGEEHGAPRQTDSGSCGVFCLLFAEALARQRAQERETETCMPEGAETRAVICDSFGFTQRDIDILRSRMVIELVAQQLYGGEAVSPAGSASLWTPPGACPR